MSIVRVFLSASIPLPGRDKAFLETADTFSIKESVRALTLVILERRGHLVFGGHPAITPVIRLMFNGAKLSTRDHITLYQSALFRKDFPAENEAFERVVIVEAVDDDREKSLLQMRRRMIGDHRFDCAVFIGGMEGVLEEFHMFAEMHPRVPVYPIASTGAAAGMLFDSRPLFESELRTELTYPTLFRKILPRSE